MRLSTEAECDDPLAAETIAVAVEAGITVFDTARAYGPAEHDLGRGERLVAGALRSAGAASRARIVTKGGMTRLGGGWVPDGRAKTILADCEASLTALGGLGIDVYLIHAPDPRTPWRTSVRALGRLLDEGMVAERRGVQREPRSAGRGARAGSARRGRGGAERVRRPRASRRDRRPLRGARHRGHRALAAGRPASRPGPGSASRLVDAARAAGATPAEIALAWLLQLSPAIVPIPGARRPETARSAARAARLELYQPPAPPVELHAAPPQARLATPRAGAQSGRHHIHRRGRGGHDHGDPGRRQDPGGRRVPGPRLPAPQPGRARRHAARALRGTRAPPRRRRSPGRARQHLPDPSRAQLCDRSGRPARDPHAMRVARHAAGPGAGQPDRAPARALRRSAHPGRPARDGSPRGWRTRPHPADAYPARTGAAVNRRRLRHRGDDSVHPRAGVGGAESRRRVRGGGGAERARVGAGPRGVRRPALPISCSTGVRMRLPMRSNRSPNACAPWSPVRSRPPSAPTAPARRAAGAARRFPASRSPSLTSTASTRRARF